MKEHPSRKLHMSNQRSFGSGNRPAETYLPPGDIGVQNLRLGSCSQIAAGSNPPSRVTFNESRQSTKTKTSAVDILSDATRSNATRHIENDRIQT
jgi:hypothetical protein